MFSITFLVHKNRKKEKGEKEKGQKMKKQLSLIMLGLLLTGMIAFLPNNVHADTPTQYNTAIVNSANRLVALQSPTDYGWDWIVTSETADSGSASPSNIYGVTCLGLIDAYELTGNAAYLTAAENAANFMVANNTPSTGGFWYGHDGYGFAYSSDYIFLMSLSTVSGISSYKTYALASWAWQKANIDRYADGNQSILWSHYADEWIGTGMYGAGAWGTSDWGLAALAMGDTVWAQDMAAVIDANMTNIAGNTNTNDYADMGKGLTLEFLATLNSVTYASDIASLKTALEGSQFSDGSWGYGSPPGDAQTTAYVVMGLWAAGDFKIAETGADWLVANQGTNGALTGGWWEYPDEISEVDSEGLQATFAVTSYASALYISPASVNMTPSEVGTTFTVSVMLSNFGNLAGFDINLTWDNNLINFVSADKAPLSILWPAGSTVVYEQSGIGYYELAAVGLATSASNTGASVLFNVTFKAVESNNFLLSTHVHFALDALSDPLANPITPTTVTDATYSMSAIVSGLEFTVEKFNKKTSTWSPVTSPYDFECGNNFTVSVYVTNVVSFMGYDLTIGFNSTLVAIPAVQTWGIFGAGTAVYTNGASGASSVQISGSGSALTGSSELLFTLQFNVQFNATPDHIWNVATPNYETFPIYISAATLYFSEGTVPMSGITMPSSLNIEIDFIRGDVLCTGIVGINDIRTLAYYFNLAVQPAGPAPPQYDLLNHHHIDIYDIVQVANNYGYGLDP